MSDPFIDVHCFAGGLALGVAQNSFELVGKKEGKGAFGAANMEANRHLLPGDWETQAGPYEEWEPLDAAVIVGNPPCSGFSAMSNKNFRGMNSVANACMWGITDYAAKVKPDIFVFESVSQAFNQGRPLMQQLRDRLEEQSGLRYDLTHVLHSARSCGAPQLRQRYFFVAHRVPFGLDAPDVTALPTVEDTIGDLVGLNLQWESQPMTQRRDDFPQFVKRRGYRDDGMIDGHMTHNSVGTRRLSELADLTDWSQGENMNVVIKRAHEEGKTLPTLWNNKLDTLIERDFYMGINQTKRMSWDKTSGACTGAALDEHLHPSEPRTLTHREVARLMGFPDEWRIEPLRETKGLAHTWGKGVTVDCGRWIGRSVRNAFDGSPDPDTGIEIGDRERLVDYRAFYKTLVPAA